MSVNGQLLGDFAFAQDFQDRVAVVRQGLGLQCLDGDFVAGGEMLLQVSDIHFTDFDGKFVVKTTLGDPADHRHRSTLESRVLRVT